MFARLPTVFAAHTLVYRRTKREEVVEALADAELTNKGEGGCPVEAGLGGRSTVQDISP